MKLSTIFAAAAVAALALPALATPRANVAFADLDFSKPADVSTFNSRLDAAAKKACRNEGPVLTAERKFLRCEAYVKSEALTRLPADGRTAYAAASGSNGVAAM